MNQTTDDPRGMPVDPCPDWFAGWSEAIDNGWLQLAEEEPDEPWRPEPRQFSDKALVAELVDVQKQLSQLHGRWLELLGEAERRDTTTKVAGLPTAAWLTDCNTHWARTAREEVRLAVQLEQQPVVADGLTAGTLSVEQARVIANGLDRLPDDLDHGQRTAVAGHLVELAREFGPYGLSRLVNRAVEVVAPEVAEDADRRAVERLEAEQHRNRYLVWNKEADGAVVLKGRLGKVEGEKLVGALRALSARHRKTAALAGQELTRAQSAADALGVLVDHYTGCQKLPKRGADRPRVLVQLDYDTLIGRLGTATLLNTAELLSAQQARVLACDAEILPMVMGGDSVPLDVGRKRRLFTSTLRTLLVARDQGCAFPTCDLGPAECEAHHTTPWWAGGITSLATGVLVCTYHHHVVEPNPNAPPGTQWAIRLDSRGLPEFGAPEGVGAPPGQRRWRQHHRFRT